jgi:hypothetical protein
MAQTDVASDTRPRIREAFTKLMAASQKKSGYLYTRYVTRRELEPDGSVRSEKKLVYRRDPWDEFIVTRLVERDGKPLPAAEAAKQEVKLQRSVADMRKAKEKPKNPEEDEELMREVPEALNYRKIGMETREGRATEVYEFTPRAAYRFRSMKTRLLEKVRGKIWVDEADGEIARLEGEVFETESVGFGFVGKIEKGTHFELERRKLDGGHWFEVWQKVRFAARVMMVKNLRQEIESRFAGFTPQPNAAREPGGWRQ